MNDEQKSKFYQDFLQFTDYLEPCMDDYLYIYDLLKDTYHISETALKRFSIPSREFHNVRQTHRWFVYEKDYDKLCENLEDIVAGKTDSHDLNYRWLDTCGKPVWINCRGTVLRDENGVAQFLVGCVNEIGKSQMADNVSGLLGESALAQKMEKLSDTRLSGFGMRIGIDGFKEVNERLGVEYGNMLIHKMGDVIEQTILPGQYSYRMVSDEFAIADYEGRTVEDALTLYGRICDAVTELIDWHDYEVFFTLSAGIVAFDELENQSHENMLKLCEFSLGQAKRLGRNRAYVFCEQDYQQFRRHRELARKLRQAVADGCRGFEAYYQPIVDTETRKLVGAETLLRFRLEDGQMVSPTEFIPILEETYLILPVGRWVMRQAMETCKKMQKMLPEFWISFNISGVQVLKSNLLEHIVSCMNEFKLPHGSVAVELTESRYLEADDTFISFCDGLREHGILLALDDFGSGYSNFSYLYHIRPYALKIDRTFTVNALKDPHVYEILQHLIDMTHCAQIRICVEGIETEGEVDMIARMEPDYIQGYFFGKPCPYEEFRGKYAVKLASVG